jgi:hypothetical protein
MIASSAHKDTNITATLEDNGYYEKFYFCARSLKAYYIDRTWEWGVSRKG